MRMAIFAGAIVALLLALASTASAETYRWKTVGADPCNPEKSGCTLEWALEQSRWPYEVQALLKEAVLHTPPEQIEICTGWRGWMTWGEYVRKFRADTLADWGPNHCESALHWAVKFGAEWYHLFKVNACGNFGGQKKRDPFVPPPPPDGPPLGTVPITYCP